jgi:phage portal protein BeeE
MATAAAVDADEAIQVSQASMFARGIHPTHAVIVGKQAGPDGSMTSGGRPKLSGAQRRQLVNTIRTLYTGAAKAGEPLILDALIEDVKKLSNTPAEMDWLDSAKFLKGRITQAFGTNPIIMGELEGANRASATAADQHFAKFTINPKIKLISECLTEWLGPMFAAEGEKLVVWIDPYVPRDDELEIRRWELVGKLGAGTVGELRAWAGLPPSDFDDMPLGQADGAAAAIEAAVASLGAGKYFDAPAHRGMNGHRLGV